MIWVVQTFSPVDPGASPLEHQDQVFWWRDAAHDVDVPRGHGVGWSTRDGAEHGYLTLVSEHLRLDANQIETLLVGELGRRAFQQLTYAKDEVSPVVRLYAAGHVVLELDLADHFGSDWVVGVAVELRGHGFAARIAHRPHLTPTARDAALAWAESQVQSFLVLSRESALEANGWTQMTPSRWQVSAQRAAPVLDREPISDQVS